MKFSTKSRYALRLMAELARYAPGTTVSLKEISERQNLSLKYLEQIVTPLARVGLVKSERGSQGGYRLTKAPADYTAGEILRAIEGSVAPIPCLGSETTSAPCPSSASPCRSGPGWTRSSTSTSTASLWSSWPRACPPPRTAAVAATPRPENLCLTFCAESYIISRHSANAA